LFKNYLALARFKFSKFSKFDLSNPNLNFKMNTKMKVNVISIVVFLCLALSAFGQATASLEDAAAAYLKGDYQTAITQYEQILATGKHSEALYYNLGNSYFKSGDLGKAILNFERVLLLDANDEATLNNLGVAKLQLKDEISTIPPFFLKKWWIGLRNMASVNVWGILGLLLFWGGIAGLAFWQLAKVREKRKQGFLTGIILILLSLLPISLALSANAHSKNSDEAIILAKEVTLRSGPDNLSNEVMVLHQGTKVELLDLIESWYKVRLANGEKGWLVAGSFEEI